MSHRKNRVKIGGIVETDKSAEEWMNDFIDWIESRNEYFGGGARKEKKKWRTNKMKLRVEGYIVHKERGREDLEPHDWDLDYLKAWLTDVFNPANKYMEVMLDITSIKRD